MDDKEARTLDLIASQLATALCPIVACSFGKDSIVLLHLCLRVQKVPVLYLRLPKFPEKHRQAQTVLEAWDLESYDLWPSHTMDYQCGDYFEVFHGYATGDGGTIWLFSGIRKRRDEETRYLCAVDDLLLRPRANGYEYPWDVTFHGHKGSDEIKFGSLSPIVHPVSQLGGTRLVVPFVDWTDDDIWAYIRKYDLPYDRQRYDAGQETVNPDTYPTCYQCLDRNEPESIACPKYRTQIQTRARTEAEHAAFREALIGGAVYCEVSGAPRSTENVAAH